MIVQNSFFFSVSLKNSFSKSNLNRQKKQTFSLTELSKSFFYSDFTMGNKQSLLNFLGDKLLEIRLQFSNKYSRPVSIQQCGTSGPARVNIRRPCFNAHRDSDARPTAKCWVTPAGFAFVILAVSLTHFFSKFLSKSLSIALRRMLHPVLVC